MIVMQLERFRNTSRPEFQDKRNKASCLWNLDYHEMSWEVQATITATSKTTSNEINTYISTYKNFRDNLNSSILSSDAITFLNTQN